MNHIQYEFEPICLFRGTKEHLLGFSTIQAVFVVLLPFDIHYFKPYMSCLFHMKLGFDEYCMKKNLLAKRLTFMAALLLRLKYCQALRAYTGT